MQSELLHFSLVTETRYNAFTSIPSRLARPERVETSLRSNLRTAMTVETTESVRRQIVDVAEVCGGRRCSPAAMVG